MSFAELPTSYTYTRESLHKLAEHVIAAARYQREQRIGLRSTERGFGTPANEDWQVRVVGDELVVWENQSEKRETISTLANMAKFVGCELGAPANVYTPTTLCEPDASLQVDASLSFALGDWYKFVDLTLHLFGTQFADRSELQLWPEHFDLAFEAGNESLQQRIGYGGSPGDEHYDRPYIYAVPWSTQSDHPIWNAKGFHGHVITWDEIRTSSDASTMVIERLDAANKRVLNPFGIS